MEHNLGNTDGKQRRIRPLTIVGAAIGVVGVATGTVVVAAPAEAVTYPSWSDVQQAKQSVVAQQKMVDQITGLAAQLQDQSQQVGMQAEIANEKYLEANITLQQATQKASTLQQQATAAAKSAKTAEVRAALLASHLARTAGSDPTITLLLEGGDSSAADQLLYQLGTMSQLTEQSQQIYNEAISARNTAQSLTEQAQAAQDVQAQAATTAQQALAAANSAASTAKTAVANVQSKQNTLVAQLASLKNTSNEVAQQYLAGQQAAAAAAAAKKAQEEAAAQAAAAQAAAAKAAAAQAAARQAASQSKGGASGGNTGVGNTSGGGGSSTPTVSSGNLTSSSSIVAAAIAYAEEQLNKPYIIDGAGPYGYDCSGLTMMAYAYAGIDIGGHSVNQQYYTAAARGQLVPLGSAEAGDLIFWGSAPGSLYHVGIYLGNGMMIAAPTVGENVKIQAVWGTPYPVAARPSAGF